MLGNGSEIGDQLAAATYYNGIDLRLGFRLNDTTSMYSTVYRRPYFGLGWYASTFDTSAIGNPHALYFFLTIPFILIEIFTLIELLTPLNVLMRHLL